MKVINSIFSTTHKEEELLVVNAMTAISKSYTAADISFIVNIVYPINSKYLYVTPTTTWLSPQYNNGSFDIYSNVDWQINEN